MAADEGRTIGPYDRDRVLNAGLKISSFLTVVFLLSGLVTLKPWMLASTLLFGLIAGGIFIQITRERSDW